MTSNEVSKDIFVSVTNEMYAVIKTELKYDLVPPHVNPETQIYVHLKFTHDQFITALKLFGSRLIIYHKMFITVQKFANGSGMIPECTIDNVINSKNELLQELFFDTYNEHLGKYNNIFERYTDLKLIELKPALFLALVKHVKTNDIADNVMTYITENNEDDSKLELYIMCHQHLISQKLEPNLNHIDLDSAYRNLKTLKYAIDYIAVPIILDKYFEGIVDSNLEIVSILKTKFRGTYIVSSSDMAKSI